MDTGYVHQINFSEIISFLKNKGRTDVENRWDNLKEQYTDSGHIFRKGFLLAFDDSDLEVLTKKDIELKNDIKVLQVELQIPLEALLLIRLDSPSLLNKDSSSTTSIIQTKHFINFIELCLVFEKKTKRIYISMGRFNQLERK
jgi:hypothetical protein